MLAAGNKVRLVARASRIANASARRATATPGEVWVESRKTLGVSDANRQPRQRLKNRFAER